MPLPPTDQPQALAAEPVPADLLAWARQTFDADEFFREVRQLEVAGGCTFESFIDELEARAGVS